MSVDEHMFDVFTAAVAASSRQYEQYVTGEIVVVDVDEEIFMLFMLFMLKLHEDVL